MEVLANIELPVLIVHRGRIFSLSQTSAGGLVLRILEEAEKPLLDMQRGSCVIVAANSTTPGGAQGMQ